MEKQITLLEKLRDRLNENPKIKATYDDLAELLTIITTHPLELDSARDIIKTHTQTHIELRKIPFDMTFILRIKLEDLRLDDMDL